MPWVHSKLLNARLSKTLSYSLPTEKYRELILPGTRALIQLEISKLPWMVTLQCPTNPICVLDVTYHYVNATLTEWQKSILILLFWGTFWGKITCEVICLMQFPTNILVSQCINTMRLILMTQNKKWQDWEQTCIPWCKSAMLRANHRAKPRTHECVFMGEDIRRVSRVATHQSIKHGWLCLGRWSSQPKQNQPKVMASVRQARRPTPVLLPGASLGQRSLVGYSPWGRKEPDTTGATEHSCTCGFSSWRKWLHVLLMFSLLRKLKLGCIKTTELEAAAGEMGSPHLCVLSGRALLTYKRDHAALNQPEPIQPFKTGGLSGETLGNWRSEVSRNYVPYAVVCHKGNKSQTEFYHTDKVIGKLAEQLYKLFP